MMHKDDALSKDILEYQVGQLMDALTRIGGEVNKMRSEVNELMTQNASLVKAYTSLRAVIMEKGTLDVDDFDLACEVLSASAAAEAPPVSPTKNQRRYSN